MSYLDQLHEKMKSLHFTLIYFVPLAVSTLLRDLHYTCHASVPYGSVHAFLISA